MQVLSLNNNISNKSYGIPYGNTDTKRNYANISRHSKSFYPSNYYISFCGGINSALMEKMQKTVDTRELMKLYEQLSIKSKENCSGVAKRFEKEGLTIENYIQSCVKQPPLFGLLPTTVENNIRDLVKKFEGEGLTVENYLNACIKKPSLFCQSPDTIEKNVRDLVKRFENEGLTLEKYLTACTKQPQLFYQSPATVAEHIKVMQFGNRNLKQPLNNSEFWLKRMQRHIEFTYSSSLLMIKYLIIPKMFENSEIPKELKHAQLREKLQKYLEANFDKNYTLNVKGTDNDIALLQKCLKELNCENRFIIKPL